MVGKVGDLGEGMESGETRALRVGGGVAAVMDDAQVRGARDSERGCARRWMSEQMLDSVLGDWLRSEG